MSLVGRDGVVHSEAEWAAWNQQEQTATQAQGLVFTPPPAMPRMTSSGPSATLIASLHLPSASMSLEGVRSMSSLSMKRSHISNELHGSEEEEESRPSAMSISMQDLVNICSIVGKNRRRRDNAREGKR